MKKHNFSAGPSILEKNVIKQAAQSILELNNIGLSILEISHRSDDFIDIITESKQLVKELLNISDEYEILFLQGGASLQFYMSALNFSRKGGITGYIDTGSWSTKAIKEAKKIGKTIIVASSRDKNHTYIPKNINLQEKMDYLHFTSNNTIYGTQFHKFPKKSDIITSSPNTKLICDMSSDIFSKNFNVNDFDLIYAGAQKNIGPAGATLVIVKKEAIESNNNLPTYLNYNTHIEKNSLFNTPPVFSIYVCMLTLRWIKESGGLKFIEDNNNNKSELIYDEIDRNPLFFGIVNKEDRSIMNATFNLKNQNLQKKFEQMCWNSGISGLNGHRSVGGYRASMYNALSIESVDTLVNIMKTLEKKA